MLQLSPPWSLRKAGIGAAQKKLKLMLALAALSAGIIYTSPVGIYHEGFTGLSSRYKWEYTFSCLVLHSLQPSPRHFQSCCATTLASVWQARHAMVLSNLFCLRSGFKLRGIFCLHPHIAAWPLTSFVCGAARRGTCCTPGGRRSTRCSCFNDIHPTRVAACAPETC